MMAREGSFTLREQDMERITKPKSKRMGGHLRKSYSEGVPRRENKRKKAKEGSQGGGAIDKSLRNDLETRERTRTQGKMTAQRAKAYASGTMFLGGE